MKKRVIIDTMVLICAMRQAAKLPASAKTPPHDKFSLARALLHKLRRNDDLIILPSVVVAEFLVKIPVVNHPKLLTVLSENFYIPAFDLRCTSLAADLMSHGFKVRKTMDDKDKPARDSVKADAMIVATAKVHSADLIYTDDDQLYKMADKCGVITNKVPSQSDDMFDDIDSRRGEL